MPTRFVATIDPQVWVGDYAVSVHPPGGTAWDCTAYVAAAGLADRIRREADGGEWLDVDDVLRADPAAPAWVGDWAGPFTITVRATPAS